MPNLAITLISLNRTGNINRMVFLFLYLSRLIIDTVYSIIYILLHNDGYCFSNCLGELGEETFPGGIYNFF